MQDFKGFGLPDALLKTLERMQYAVPTPIQVKGIPLALAGKDILGSAQTGTGKTAAFGIPLITKLMNSPRGSALILTPTRELATQVLSIIKQLMGQHSTIGAALIIGGESMPAQINQLRQRPRIIVGTPGRINDHLERGTLMLHDVSFLVLDETDRMLDMGFQPQLEKIVKFLPKTRQTLLFSATLPDNIVKLSSKYLTNPERISVGSTNKAHISIKQEVVYTTADKKYDALLAELDKRNGSIIIFVKTKHGADRLAQKLNKMKHSAEAIHGDLRQRQRDRVISAFRDMKHRIMVATDIAARGLDIPHIEHVINYDLPQCPEDYIHRVGRTGRAGAEGSSVALLAPEDSDRWKDIHKLMHPGEPLPPRHPNAGERSARPQQHGRGSHHGQGQQGHGRDGQANGGKGRPRRRNGGGSGGQGGRPQARAAVA